MIEPEREPVFLDRLSAVEFKVSDTVRATISEKVLFTALIQEKAG